MTIIKKGSWVQIRQTVLNPADRAPQVPEDTKKVPLQLWVKGELMQDASLGDTITITTATGRMVTGELVAENPPYIHSFGNFVPELRMVGEQARTILSGGKA